MHFFLKKYLFWITYFHKQAIFLFYFIYLLI
jgi:hypothetical protein